MASSGVRALGVACAALMTVGISLAVASPGDPAGDVAGLGVTDTARGGALDRTPPSRGRAPSGPPGRVTDTVEEPVAGRVPDSVEEPVAGRVPDSVEEPVPGQVPQRDVPGPGSASPVPTAPSAPQTAGVPQGSPTTSTAPGPTPASGGGSTPAPATASATVASLPHLSGMTWRSGVYTPGSTATTYAAFGSWRGRALDVVVDWSARQSWAEIVDPDWLYRAWANTPYTKVFGVAMVPEGDGSATIARCASGAYDDHWREFGRNITAAGLAGSSIIRLGWEFNGNWYKWSAYDPAAWAECWRQIVTAAEETAPALRWEWTVNRGAGQSLRDPRQAWPGDAYVDIVGVDSYDMYPGVRNESQWQQHLSGEFGLRFWADFARAHGKPLSVPEWGVYPGTLHAGNNGGDNPFYVQKMHEFFRSLGSLLAYEAYFNDRGSYYAGSLWSPVQVPVAAEAYRRLWAT